MNTRKLITFSPTQCEMVDMLMKQDGYLNFNDVVRAGITELYRTTFPAYKNTAVRGTNKEEIVMKNAEIRAKAKVNQEDAEKKARLEKKITMCGELFDGEVMERGDGSMVCVFTQYNLTGKDVEQQVPIAQLDPIMAETSLFIPSKEAIFRNRSDIKRKFSKLKRYADETTDQEKE